MKYAIMAAALTVGIMCEARAENPVPPPAPPQGIPVQSPTLLAELIKMHEAMLEMHLEQVETNRMLGILAHSTSSTSTP